MKKTILASVFCFAFISQSNAQNPLSSTIDSLISGQHNNLSLNLNSFRLNDLGQRPFKNIDPGHQMAAIRYQATYKHTMPIYQPEGHHDMPNFPIDSAKNYSLKIYKPE